MSEANQFENLRAAAGPGAECLAIEELDSALAAPPSDPRRQAIERHLAGCGYCRTELAMLRSFEQAQPRPEEELPVKWIVNKLAGPAPRRSLLSTGAARAWAAAACLVIVAGSAVYLRQRPDAPLLEEPGREIVRSEGVAIEGPSGDVTARPADLRWRAVPGAARYEVRLLEVDRTELWHGTTETASIALPAAVQARIVPGKTLVWEVTVKSAKGTEVAKSGQERFRLVP